MPITRLGEGEKLTHPIHALGSSYQQSDTATIAGSLLPLLAEPRFGTDLSGVRG